MATFMRIVAAGLLLAMQAVGVASAREPGVGLSFIPGVTLGQANAVPLDPGFRLATRTTYNDAIALGKDGQELGLRYHIANEIVLLTWVPDWKLLDVVGPKVQIVLPFASSTLVRDAPVAKPLRGTFIQIGMGNPKLQVELSAPLGDGFYASAGLGVYFPLGQWTKDQPLNLGSPFWSLETNGAFTYFKDGWTASLQGSYVTNTSNTVTNYYSGDQLVLNATFMKSFSGVNIGPVGYWQKQVNDDVNGGTSVLRGRTALPGEQIAIGGFTSTQFGNLSVSLMFTQDVWVRNALQGSKGWLGLSYRFW